MNDLPAIDDVCGDRTATYFYVKPHSLCPALAKRFLMRDAVEQGAGGVTIVTDATIGDGYSAYTGDAVAGQNGSATNART